MSADDAFTIRDVGVADADALVACFARNDLPVITATFDPFPLDAAMARMIAEAPRKDRYYGAFAEDGRIVGVAMLRGFDEGYEVPSFGVFVDHAAHRQGLGSALLDHAISDARNLGAPRIRLSVYASNASAHGIYRSRGFREVERRPAQVAGRGDERVVMLLDLQAARA